MGALRCPYILAVYGGGVPQTGNHKVFHLIPMIGLNISKCNVGIDSLPVAARNLLVSFTPAPRRAYGRSIFIAWFAWLEITKRFRGCARLLRFHFTIGQFNEKIGFLSRFFHGCMTSIKM